MPEEKPRLAEAGPVGSLLDFVPRLTPSWVRPEHLSPVAEAFERALTQSVRILLSVPPQHGKTELIKHALVWLMVQRAALRHAYVSYESKRAWRISRQIAAVAKRAGLEPDGPREQWSIAGGGSLAATGANGALTGEPVDGVLVIDDPHKNRKAAESRVQRQDVKDFLTSTAETRMHPGASIIIVHTRWHPDDLIGQCARDEGWTYINLPAVNDGSDPRRPVGAALWEAARPLAWLEEKRGHLTEYDWASLYQGQPRPRGDTLFTEPHYYDELPEGCAVGYGVDLAYTAKTSAHYSVAVRMARKGDVFYVTEVQRKQVDATSFALTLRAMHRARPGYMLWHCASSELGAGSFLKQAIGGNWFRPELASAVGDKFLRAQPVSAAWKAGKVLLPNPEYRGRDGKKRDVPWLDAFLSEVMAFTGVNDASDDQVDALASAYHLMSTKPAPRSTGGYQA